MKPKVIEEKCIGCGSCVSLTDQKIFDFNDEGKAQAITNTLSEEDINLVKNAMDYCPTDAIELIPTEKEQTKQEITKETLKPKVIEEKCIGCGSCVSLTDQKIFDFNDEGKAQAITNTLSEEDINLVKNTMDYCPTDAIELVENDEEK